MAVPRTQLAHPALPVLPTGAGLFRVIASPFSIPLSLRAPTYRGVAISEIASAAKSQPRKDTSHVIAVSRSPEHSEGEARQSHLIILSPLAGES